MLAPRAANAFVCIRCEIQLAQRRLPVCARSTSHASFSTSPFSHHGSDEPADLSNAPASKLKIIKEVQILNRITRRKGKVIRETSARLGGLKRLGNDADILMLRELEYKTPAGPPLENLEPIEPLPVPDFLASLEEERHAPTGEEIFKRLESLRPPPDAESLGRKWAHFVPQATFRKLSRDLKNGFTKIQLERFFLAKKYAREEDVHDAVLASLGREGLAQECPNSRTDWQPGLTDMAVRLPGVDIAVDGAQSRGSLVNKPLLVDRIMRDVWKLVPQEEIEAPGEIELSLKRWQLHLLTKGDKDTPLSRIAEARKVTINVHLEHIVVRVSADKNTAQYAANDIEEALGGVHTKQLRLQLWMPHFQEKKTVEAQSLFEQQTLVSTLFTEEDLNMVSAVTGAIIEPKRDDEHNDTLVIRALVKGAAADAERSLIRLLPLKDATRRTLDDRARDNRTRLLPAVYDRNSIDYKYRNAGLGRWKAIMARDLDTKVAGGQEGQMILSSDETQKQVTQTVSILQDSLDQEAKMGSDAESERKDVGSWSGPRYKLSAEFGQVLFPFDDTAFPSVFTPNSPGLTSLMSAAYSQNTHEANTAQFFQAAAPTEAPLLVYNFRVSPENQSHGRLLPLPTLHIQMRTSLTGGTPTLHKISLGINEHIHELLLPNMAADIRFVKHTRLHFREKHKDKDVITWVSHVSANIMSGERLTAPSIAISIPKWVISGYPETVGGVRQIDYILTDIQFRQAINGTFYDNPVSYTTLQSSKMNGRGGSLCMTCSGVPRRTRLGLLEQQDYPKLVKFVQGCFGVASAITKAASQKQPLSKQMHPKDRPRDEQSARKLRRLAQHGADSDEGVLASEEEKEVAQPKVEERASLSAEDKLETNAVDSQRELP
ncbi:mitochondrial inner-membrane-bound regulator-domain-containing protein [Phaeosphaeriaceae sp. PMI808]|nr:mitochondrial inner-membrane-bound regulator-domain-containing protein [Phaeosphaeriaceae sp. PMI808]